MERYIRNEELITSDLDEDLVMLDISQGKYFSLNPVGKRIWEMLEEKRSLEDLTVLLMDEFDVDEKECTQDVKQHLQELMELKLVTRTT